jgi:hypothetical protein
MKIFELYNPNMKREEFDLNDDLIFFMRNDPQFYRGEYHPFLQKFKRHCEAGRGVRPAAFAPIVQKAFEHYKNTFPVEGMEQQLSRPALEEICDKLQGEETNFYHDEKQRATEKKDDPTRTI